MKSMPSTAHAHRVRDLFDEVAGLAPDAQQTRLNEIAASDPELAHAVAALLAAEHRVPEVWHRFEQALEQNRHAALDASVEANAPKRVGQYEVREKQGTGGMGVVYRAYDRRLDRFVALKFLPFHLNAHPEAKQRFIQEARAASALDHPNICTIYDVGEAEDGRLFIAMAYYEGRSLQQRLREGTIAIEGACRYAAQIGAGLQRAHEAGIVHRDVKPANVMITVRDEVKLLDFGIAKVADTGVTRTGARIGTAAYMSPEQARGEAVDARTDVWALGVLLYEMLTGRHPFAAAHEHAVVYRILHEDPEPVSRLRPDVPPWLARLVDTALAKDPARRYPSMRALLDVLDAPETAARRVWKPSRKGRLLAAIGMVLLALGAWLRPGLGGHGEVVPVENTLAVMYFENRTQDPSLDWVEAGMVEMLTTGLGQFEGLAVLSSQRLFDIAQQVRGRDTTRIDPSTATVIAKRAGVGTMVLGHVVGDAAHLRLQTQIVEVETGRLIAGEVVDAGPGHSLIALADTLTHRVAARLALRPPSRNGNRPLAYTLTTSPAALQRYVEGVQALYGTQYAQAIVAFDEAVAHDSTFAMAYYHRELAHSWLTGNSDRDALEHALRFGDRISERERALIAATFTMMEDLPTRKAAFESLTERYPDEKFGWYQLGEIYFHNYWPRRSAEAFRRASDLDPYFLLAYAHPLDFHFYTDDYSQARTYLDRRRALEPEGDWTLETAYLDFAARPSDSAQVALMAALRARTEGTAPDSLADEKAALAFLARDWAALEATLRAFRQAGHYGDEGYLLATNSLAGLVLLQGRLADAERHLADARRRSPDRPAQLYEDGLFHLLRGRTDAAQASARRILNLHDNRTAPFPEVAALGWHLLALVHIASQEAPEAGQAAAALERLKRRDYSEFGFLADDVLGRLACIRGDYATARQHFAEARTGISFTGTQNGIVVPFPRLLLDAELACLERAGQPEDVVRRAADVPLVVHRYHHVNASAMAVWVRTQLRMARAYEALGQNAQARRQYLSLLELWKDADANTPGLAEARAAWNRLAWR